MFVGEPDRTRDGDRWRGLRTRTHSSGPVYLTGPYNGSPYGLSIAVPAIAGPFDLGTVLTRASIGVDPHTARVIVSEQPADDRRAACRCG